MKGKKKRLCMASNKFTVVYIYAGPHTPRLSIRMMSADDIRRSQTTQKEKIRGKRHRRRRLIHGDSNGRKKQR